MIEWPNIKYGDPTPEGKAMDDSWNSCRTACIEAEKNGRMSVEDIADIISKGVFNESLNESKPVRNLEIYGVAQAIHAALYDDTQPGKQKAGKK